MGEKEIRTILSPLHPLTHSSSTHLTQEPHAPHPPLAPRRALHLPRKLAGLQIAGAISLPPQAPRDVVADLDDPPHGARRRRARRRGRGDLVSDALLVVALSRAGRTRLAPARSAFHQSPHPHDQPRDRPPAIPGTRIVQHIGSMDVQALRHTLPRSDGADGKGASVLRARRDGEIRTGEGGGTDLLPVSKEVVALL